MSLFEDLKRRNVIRVAVAYVVAAWLIIQVVETIFPAFGFGDAVVRIAVVVFGIGFIPVLIITWVFELTPEGLKKEREIDRTQTVTRASRPKLDNAIIGLLIIALGYFAYDKFVLEHDLPVSPERWEQLTSFPDSASQPALSADGRMLVFIRGPGPFVTPGQIYSKLLPDGRPVALTQDDLKKMSPVFSPDGTRIAYTVAYGTFEWDTWQVETMGGEAGRWLPNASGLIWAGEDSLLFSEIIPNEGIHMKIVAARETRADSRDVYVPEHIDGMAHRSYASPDGSWAIVVEMGPNAAFLPCRLVSLRATDSDRSVGPPDGECTVAEWSPDGEWMYFTSNVGGSNHIWRQRFPDGELQQVTVGATQEEGIAVSPDGDYLVTAVALKQSSVWVSSGGNERAISSEGYAFDPELTPDGRFLLFRILRGTAPQTDPSELWIADLVSGRTEPFLPGFSLFGSNAYDISSDGSEVVIAAPDSEGASRLWLARLDRSASPQPIPGVEGDQPLFGSDDEVFFRAIDERIVYAYRVRQDGTDLRRAIERPVTHLVGMSPDGESLIVFAGRPQGESGGFTQAFPLSGGEPIQLYSGAGSSYKIGWTADNKYLMLPGATGEGPWLEGGGFGQTVMIPIPPGQMFPQIPAEGFTTDDAIAAIPGIRIIEFGDVVPGPTPDIYAYSQQTVQRNLYRIPLP
jgi:Tol biopolymer transport system component